MNRIRQAFRELRCAIPLLAITLAARADDCGQWIDMSPMNIDRQEQGGERVGEKVYVFGGLRRDPTRATASVEVYDIPTDQWTVLANMPEPLDHVATAVVNGKIYVCGGFAGDFTARSAVWRYDPQQDSWSGRAPLPEPRGASWAIAYRGKIYLFGGDDETGEEHTTTYIYDPQLDGWSTGADMPNKREHLNAVVVDDYIYVIGGRSELSAPRDFNERYDPASDTWVILTPMPTRRSSMAMAAFGRRIMCAGGAYPTLHDENEVYDITTDTWTSCDPMPVPRQGLVAITLDDRILVPGGSLTLGLVPTTHVDSFILSPATNGDPNALTVVFGAHRGGGLSSLSNDDDIRLIVEQRPAVTPQLPLIRVDIDAIAPTDAPAQLDVTIETSTSALPNQPPQELLAFNYDMNMFELLDARPATLSDTEIVVSITTDPGRFIEPGTNAMRMRIDWFHPGNVFTPAWVVRIDQAMFTITP